MTTKRKPGPAKGTPAAGHRPATPPATLDQKVLWARWQLFPAALRPTVQAMAAAVGLHRDTWHRKLKAEGAGLTDAQLAAANALLDAAAPQMSYRTAPAWPQSADEHDPT
ncbi:MAG: hypothetical protein NVS3B25_33580 [Hymenobacter sp.]